MIILYIIYFLIIVTFTLAAYAILQIKLFGMNIKDFWSFIEANEMLDKLYTYSKQYEKMNSQMQIIFLKEAETVFDAFDKVPSSLWEDEYEKYSKVLENYKNIKMLRWAEANS